MSATTHVAAAETAVAAAKACVSTGAAEVSAASAAVTSAMLRPQGYGHKQGERRNRHQTPHIGLLYARYARNLSLCLPSKAGGNTCRSYVPKPPSIRGAGVVRPVIFCTSFVLHCF